MNEIKLDGSQKHMLRLVAKGASADGWAPVSALVYPLLGKMPSELVVLESIGDEGRGRVRLTDEGGKIIDAMEWGLA